MATGSNDKLVKVLYMPNFYDGESAEDMFKDVQELEFKGHKAIVRTVCFNPSDDGILLSGGVMDSNMFVWDTKTG